MQTGEVMLACVLIGELITGALVAYREITCRKVDGCYHPVWFMLVILFWPVTWCWFAAGVIVRVLSWPVRRAWARRRAILIAEELIRVGRLPLMDRLINTREAVAKPYGRTRG